MKYNVGDTVWTRGWTGYYIPDCFVVAAARCVNGKWQYRKKRMRTWWDEDKLFPTEEACQISEIRSFVSETQKFAKDTVQNARLLGLEQQAVRLLTAPVRELPAPSKEKKKIFNVGEHVWGCLELRLSFNDYANPKEYIITSRSKCRAEGETYYTYTVKGHGTRTVDERSIFATKGEAILAHARRLRDDTETKLHILKERCKTLNLPANSLLMLENNNN